ncbi:hypothetical protein [Mycobacterium numidiamassiliense]|uniref:hypothetical protein n=1 Tax=Mycobacterium numidiamassiliense TaxID=1841861 RepID=UPI001056B079|nr:hypothetical protein [Mycobacterium numidiamassiliense]
MYDESKAAVDVLDQLLIRYRTNTTAVLALGTGAATFFGFSDSPKGLFFLLSLVSYAVGVGVAVRIYWPRRWRDDIYHVLEDSLRKSPPPASMELRRDLARHYQQAIARGLELRTRRAWEFRILLFATACVVIFAGINSYCASQQSDDDTAYSARVSWGPLCCTVISEPMPR